MLARYAAARVASARRVRNWLRSLAVLLCSLALLGALAQGVLVVPKLDAHVIDTTGTLSNAQARALENKLTAFEQGSGAQVVILMVPTTQPEDIASYGNRVGNTWKIGRKGIGDGLLLVVAKTDHKVRIEVAKSLEGAIPDLAAKQIIDEAISPHFRQGDFAGGLDAAADQIIARIKGEALPAPVGPPQHRGDGFQWTDVAVLLFFAVPIGGAIAHRIFGRPLGAVVTGGAFGALALLLTSSVVIAGIAGLLALLFALVSGYGRGLGAPGWGAATGGWGSGSGGGGGFSSGGFSSGGGGDFGGGGASGSW